MKTPEPQKPITLSEVDRALNAGDLSRHVWLTGFDVHDLLDMEKASYDVTMKLVMIRHLSREQILRLDALFGQGQVAMHFGEPK